MLPGRTAAKVRVKASVLLTRFLAGDLTLVGEVYGMAALQEYLREHQPDHPLCAFREAVDAGQTAESSTSQLVELQIEEKRFDLEAKREKHRLELECQQEKHRLELERAREARQQEQQRRQVLSEEFTSEHLLKKARFQNEVQKDFADGKITEEQYNQIIGKQTRVRINKSLTDILSQNNLAGWHCGQHSHLVRGGLAEDSGVRKEDSEGRKCAACCTLECVNRRVRAAEGKRAPLKRGATVARCSRPYACLECFSCGCSRDEFHSVRQVLWHQLQESLC